MSEIIKQTGVISGKGTLYNPPIKIIPPNESVEIGKYCAIGPNLKILGINKDYNFPSIQNTFYKTYFNCEHPNSKKNNIHSKGKIKIGNDVWIGEDVVILSDVSIGDGCCIGTRSVITKNLEPYTISVGTPCKTVKLRYSKEIIAFLLDLKWWDWDDEKIKKNKDFFMTDLNTVSDIDDIISKIK